MDVAEMSLAKTNRELAESFLSLGARPDVTDAILTILDLTVTAVLAVVEQPTCCCSQSTALRLACRIRASAPRGLGR